MRRGNAGYGRWRRQTNLGNLDGLDGPAPVENLFSANAPLMAYLLFAYKIIRSRRAASSIACRTGREPASSKSTRAHGLPARDQLRLMVQTLLAGRFKLAIRREIQTRGVAALSLVQPGIPGPYLKPHPTDEP